MRGHIIRSDVNTAKNERKEGRRRRRRNCSKYEDDEGRGELLPRQIGKKRLHILISPGEIRIPHTWPANLRSKKVSRHNESMSGCIMGKQGTILDAFLTTINKKSIENLSPWLQNQLDGKFHCLFLPSGPTAVMSVHWNAPVVTCAQRWTKRWICFAKQPTSRQGQAKIFRNLGPTL